jgi:hypothetical protein
MPPPAKATVAQARSGLKFALNLGVKGKVVVTIEVGAKRKVVGRTRARTRGGKTKLTAKIGAAAAHRLAGHGTRAKIHVEVIPDAASEGFSTHGRKYFRLTLTG